MPGKLLPISLIGLNRCTVRGCRPGQSGAGCARGLARQPIFGAQAVCGPRSVDTENCGESNIAPRERHHAIARNDLTGREPPRPKASELERKLAALEGRMRRCATRRCRSDGLTVDAQLVTGQRRLVAGVKRSAASRAASTGIRNFAGTSGAGLDERRLYHRSCKPFVNRSTPPPASPPAARATPRSSRADGKTPPHRRPQWPVRPLP
jgi:hypothetical protein